MKAIVTGGSKGLGLKISKMLLEQGWEVVVGSRNKDNLDKAKETLGTKGVQFETLDVSSEASVINFFNKIDGDIHLLVNNAGKNLSKPLIKLKKDNVEVHSFEDWNATINLCLSGVFLCGREAAKRMTSQLQSGCIINISSTTSNGSYGQSAYTAAKAGVETLTRTWALELSKYNIRVVAIAPGVIEGEALAKKSLKYPKHKQYMDSLKEKVPLKRWATEEEVAKTILFVVENQYITGSVIRVDGGGLPNKL